MSFRLLPFQFSATDPVARQRDLEKQFGLTTTKAKNMFVDTESLSSSNAGSGGFNSATSSPRLQHRVPIFTADFNHPSKSLESENCNTEENKKPKVRVVPIKIEGATPNYPSRHQIFSKPFVYGNEPSHDYSPMNYSTALRKRSMQDTSSTNAAKVKPCTCNIPIKIEGRDQMNACSRTLSAQNLKSKKPTFNGSSAIDHTSTATKIMKQPSFPQDDCAVPLEKIADVLKDVNSYRTEVENFSGIAKNKQYRYLDEMLTRCMINLDNVDTMGNDQVRASRKAAVKEVQTLADLLESKFVAGDNVKETTNSADLHVRDEITDAEMEATNSLLTDVEFKEATDPQDKGIIETKDEVNNFKLLKDSVHDIGQKPLDEQLSETEMEVADKIENSLEKFSVVQEKGLNSILTGQDFESQSEHILDSSVQSSESNHSREDYKNSEHNIKTLNIVEPILQSDCDSLDQASPASVQETCVNSIVEKGQIANHKSGSNLHIEPGESNILKLNSMSTQVNI